ncbi:WD40/YVTN/BNR-like repeat-containing protein [Haladaptatus sp. NG-WS-4]
MAQFARSRHGFVAFFRRYTKTWVHAVATAALTAFGMLTFVHRGFAVVAVALYVLPPLALYVSGSTFLEQSSTDDTTSSMSETDAREAETTSDGAHAASDEEEPSGWTTVDTPIDVTLFDAVLADGGAYAVGEDGVVLADGAADEGERTWSVALQDGPRAEARDLHGTDATADGGAVWFAGDGGSLGRLNPASGRHTDFSAPTDITDNWTDVAVGGAAGGETVLLVNGSGEVLAGEYRDGDVAWDVPTKPGSGSSLRAVTLVDSSVGYLCDTNDSVFETTDGGETFRQVGIDAVDGTLTDIAATGRNDCTVTADDGVFHRYDGNWTPTRLGEEALWSLARADGRTVAVGAAGIVYERASDTADWERFTTPVSASLRGVAVGSRRAVAVGKDGAVVVRDE